MTVLYVTSDQPQSGKTAICASIAADLADKGKTVLVMKQNVTNSDSDLDSYLKILSGSPLVKVHSSSFDISPNSSTKDMKSLLEELVNNEDVVLIEGTPNIEKTEVADFTEAVEAQILVVVGYKPNLTAENLVPFKTKFGNRLIGFIINGLTRYRKTTYETDLMPTMKTLDLVPLGAVPEDRIFLGVTVEELKSHLGGRYVTSTRADNELVKSVMVGGLGMDSGATYFGLRENKAVVVRGDRPDIQMSALETSTACMVLANGIHPIEYVVNEAELEGVPLISVESTTVNTMTSMERLLERSQFDHPGKLALFVELIRKHVDSDKIYSALGLSV